jgi:hypothetical protein
MNDKRREILRRVLNELQAVLKEEEDAFDNRPENLYLSEQTRFHEERFLVLDDAVEKLRKAIFDYEFRIEEEAQEEAKAMKKIQHKGTSVAAPDLRGIDAESIGLIYNQTKALGRMILEIIKRSENPTVTASSKDQIKILLLLTKSFKEAQNPEAVSQKIDLYFDSAASHALEIFSAEALGRARGREEIDSSLEPGS